MEEEKARVSVERIFIVLLLTIIGSLIGYIVVSKRTFTDDVVEEIVDLNVVTIDTVVSDGNSNFKVLINGNVIELESMQSAGRFTVVDNIVLYNIYENNIAKLVLVDSSGKVIKSYTGLDAQANSLSGRFYRGEYEVDGDNIYIISDNIDVDNISRICELFRENANDVVSYKQKISYLGDGSFSALELSDVVSVSDYINKMGIDCSLVE